MKHFIQGFITAGLILGTQVTQAAPLTIPNTFAAGAPAVAADVNANFTASKAAVDDNDARITALDARIAALETVTDTNNSVLTLAKAAGNWAMLSNTFESIKAGVNSVDIFRDIDYATMVVNTDGTFTISFLGGSQVSVSLTNTSRLVSPGVTTFDQDVLLAEQTSTPFVVTGTFTATGNSITASVPAIGMTLNGFISQNGQVMIMQGDNGAPNANNFMTMIKIN